MPLNNPSPNFALLPSFNARTWSGVNVFDRGSNNITLPTYALGAGIYEDVISFLNGRGSDDGFSMGDLIQAAAPFGSNWAVPLSRSDIRVGRMSLELDRPLLVRLRFLLLVLIIGREEATLKAQDTKLLIHRMQIILLFQYRADSIVKI